MIAGKYNIIAYKNRDYYQTFVFDIVVDTSYFYAAIDKKGVDVNFVVNIINTNTIALSLDKSTINEFAVGSYKWDLKMVTGGLSKQVIEGIFEVRNSVTD